MAGFCQAKKLPNVVGRIDYISNPKRQEHIEDYHNTADLDFWKLLADESQRRHKQQSQPKIVKKNGEEITVYVQTKCCEAREFIVALPQDCDWTAKEIAEWFKKTYSVECAVALHWKSDTQNYHAHIIYSERELLKEPKVSKRAFYYNEQGKPCKKAKAVKVVPKGTVNYFSKKSCDGEDNKKAFDFKKFSFAMDFKSVILYDTLNLEPFDYSRHYPQQKYGKGNSREEIIKAKNKLVVDLNEYFDLIEPFYDGSTPKQIFESTYNVHYISCDEFDDIKAYFDEFKEDYPLTPEMAESLLSPLSERKNELEYDLKRAEKMYKPTTNEFDIKINNQYKKELEPKYQSKGDSLIEKIKSLLDDVVYKIEKLLFAFKKHDVDLPAGRQHNITNDFDDYEY